MPSWRKSGSDKMTAISWESPLNGDWNVATNWSTGTVPTLSDDVTISASGPYIVNITSIDLANSLTFDAPQAALIESAGELLVDGALTVNSGFVSLNAANTISNVAHSRRHARVRQYGSACRWRGRLERRRTARDRERNPEQYAHRFGAFDDRRRAWDDAQRKFDCLRHRPEYDAEFRRGRPRRNRAVAYQRRKQRW